MAKPAFETYVNRTCLKESLAWHDKRQNRPCSAIISKIKSFQIYQSRSGTDTTYFLMKWEGKQQRFGTQSKTRQDKGESKMSGLSQHMTVRLFQQGVQRITVSAVSGSKKYRCLTH